MSGMSYRLGVVVARMSARDGAKGTLQRLSTVRGADLRITQTVSASYACLVLVHGQTRTNRDGALVTDDKLRLTLSQIESNAVPTTADRVVVGATTFLIGKVERETSDNSTTIGYICEVTEA